MGLNTPIAFIVYNRPIYTDKTFEIIRSQKPKKLFLIADGPNPFKNNDNEACQKVRKIVENINWDCEVYSNYSKKNLGLKNRVSSGLNWVFSNVDKAIILEDDCVAHPDFFVFCEEILKYYENDERISVVTGNNFQDGKVSGQASYYFSKYPHCWGWATWRRSWRFYNGDISFWPKWKLSQDWLKKHSLQIERIYWEKIFNKVFKGEIDSWAYPWTLSNWYFGGLTVTPNKNLVSNIGFGEDATHTKSKKSKFYKMQVHKLGNLKHPTVIKRDNKFDNYVFFNHYGGKNLVFPLNLISFSRTIITSLVNLFTLRFFKKKN